MTETTPRTGLTRRQVATGAAWSLPVIALAVAAPARAASGPVYDTPTAYVTGTLAATGTAASTRTATYSGGALAYNAAGNPAVDSGTITLTVYNSKSPQWSLSTPLASIVAAYEAAGWLTLSATEANLVFTHAPVSDGQVVTMPTISWTAPAGSTKPLLGISVSSTSDDVTGQGLAFT